MFCGTVCMPRSSHYCEGGLKIRMSFWISWSCISLSKAERHEELGGRAIMGTDTGSDKQPLYIFNSM